MSDKPTVTRQDPAKELSAGDIRKITGAATPHFAQQIRERVIELIDTLPDNHPARAEGKREAARLQKLAGRASD